MEEKSGKSIGLPKAEKANRDLHVQRLIEKAVKEKAEVEELVKKCINCGWDTGNPETVVCPMCKGKEFEEPEEKSSLSKQNIEDGMKVRNTRTGTEGIVDLSDGIQADRVWVVTKKDGTGFYMEIDDLERATKIEKSGIKENTFEVIKTLYEDEYDRPMDYIMENLVKIKIDEGYGTDEIMEMFKKGEIATKEKSANLPYGCPFCTAKHGKGENKDCKCRCHESEKSNQLNPLANQMGEKAIHRKEKSGEFDRENSTKEKAIKMVLKCNACGEDVDQCENCPKKFETDGEIWCAEACYHFCSKKCLKDYASDWEDPSSLIDDVEKTTVYETDEESTDKYEDEYDQYDIVKSYKGYNIARYANSEGGFYTIEKNDKDITEDNHFSTEDDALDYLKKNILREKSSGEEMLMQGGNMDNLEALEDFFVDYFGTNMDEETREWVKGKLAEGLQPDEILALLKVEEGKRKKFKASREEAYGNSQRRKIGKYNILLRYNPQLGTYMVISEGYRDVLRFGSKSGKTEDDLQTIYDELKTEEDVERLISEYPEFKASKEESSKTIKIHGMDATLPDKLYYDLDNIAMEEFGAHFEDLSDSDKKYVLETYDGPDSFADELLVELSGKKEEKADITLPIDQLGKFKPGDKITVILNDDKVFGTVSKYYGKGKYEIKHHGNQFEADEGNMEYASKSPRKFVSDAERLQTAWMKARARVVGGVEKAGKLDYLAWSRKPSDWNDVMNKVPKDVIPGINSMKIVEIDNPMDNFEKVMPQYFIAKSGGREFLIDTQGYNYCRYAIELASKKGAEKSTKETSSYIPVSKDMSPEETTSLTDRLTTAKIPYRNQNGIIYYPEEFKEKVMKIVLDMYGVGATKEKSDFSENYRRPEETSETYEPPESGDLPAEGKKILAATYSSCRSDGGDKEKCSKIAWGAVRKAGFTKESYAK